MSEAPDQETRPVASTDSTSTPPAAGDHSAGTHNHGFAVELKKRWPLLAGVLSTALTVLIAVSHTMVGFGETTKNAAHLVELGKEMIFGERKKSPDERHVETPKAETPSKAQPAELPAKPLPPATLSVVTDQSRALDGYKLTRAPAIPSDVNPDLIFPGGAKVRLALQATDATRVVEFHRLGVDVRRLKPTTQLAFDYVVEPRKQPGFGPARPHQFNVQVKDTGVGDAFYLGDKGVAERVALDNLLPKKKMPILHLDAQAGLQEAFDLNVVPREAGVYEIKFKAQAVSGGNVYELETTPLYIVRK